MFQSSSGYYPNNRLTLEKEVKEFLNSPPSRETVPELVLAPHGSTNDCGEILGRIYSSINHEKFNNVVILGPPPVKTGPELGFVDEGFKTPLGEIGVDTAFTTQLELSEVFEKRDDFMHLSFIEMQLIFLQTVKEDFEVVPVTVSEDLGEEKMEKAVNVLKEHLNPQDLVVCCSNLASSRSTEEEIKNQDSELIKSLRKGRTDNFAKKAEKYGMDGSKALITGMKIRDKYQSINIIGHRVRTPDKILKPETTGYAGIIFE